MEAEELRAELQALYGRREYIGPAMRALRVSRSTLNRWLSGYQKIPHTAALAVRGLRASNGG